MFWREVVKLHGGSVVTVREDNPNTNNSGTGNSNFYPNNLRSNVSNPTDG
jgi:hypothetical protein